MHRDRCDPAPARYSPASARGRRRTRWAAEQAQLLDALWLLRPGGRLVLRDLLDPAARERVEIDAFLAHEADARRCRRDAPRLRSPGEQADRTCPVPTAWMVSFMPLWKKKPGDRRPRAAPPAARAAARSRCRPARPADRRCRSASMSTRAAAAACSSSSATGSRAARCSTRARHGIR